jgi:rare lipoprotein A (peptidoglycan hydrolase)
MKQGWSRPARKDDLERALGSERRLSGRLRRVASAAALALLCTGAVSAQAATGGASPIAESGSSSAVGTETAFSPFRVAGASWYGPGLYGRKTACGEVLRSNTIGVAHRNLPCGTTVKFLYHGHALVTQVIDRGPYVNGRAWDLTEAAGKALALEGVGRVRYAVAVEYARAGARP